MRHSGKVALAATLFLLSAGAALAQGAGGGAAGVTGIPGLDALLPPGNGAASGRILQIVALLTVLSLAPGLLVMVTSFTRFAVAFSFLRSGIGLQSTPANLFLVSLSLFMTFYVMAPTFDRAWNEGVRPLQENRITEEEAFTRITDPFREFMSAQVRPKDLQTFQDLASRTFPKPQEGEKIDLRILIPAFMISELRRLRDRVPHRPPLPRHRHDRLDHRDVDGHDDAAADGDLAAVQGAVLHPDRRMEPAGERLGAIVLLTPLRFHFGTSATRRLVERTERAPEVRRTPPPHPSASPQARSPSRMCPGAGASTVIAGFFR